MILHTVNKSPLQSSLLEDCLELADEQAAILLLEDAVLAIFDTALNRELLADIPQQLFALKEDVVARGLGDKLLARVTLVDYAGFVTLCCQATKVVSWC